mmetsp:Transcript_8734/g.17581  ORF Transcript_8734/g.17581 Transcript_8734/m.17581 type:complete len:111 (-) Transcript_8734:1033-1365(-)
MVYEAVFLNKLTRYRSNFCYNCWLLVGSKSTVNWAIAGRSKAKLNQTLESISMELGNVDVKNVDVIITDTSDKTTLKNLVTDTRAVITTAGPFQKYGECKHHGFLPLSPC